MSTVVSAAQPFQPQSCQFERGEKTRVITSAFRTLEPCFKLEASIIVKELSDRLRAL